MFKRNLLAVLCGTFLSLGFANAQLSLEENKSLAQLETEDKNVFNSPKIEKMKKQLTINAGIVATGMLCHFPRIETESLHNFFLMQFAKYEFSREEQEAIIILHKDAVTDFINKNKGTISSDKCNKFKPEFQKIYDYAKEYIKK